MSTMPRTEVPLANLDKVVQETLAYFEGPGRATIGRAREPWATTRHRAPGAVRDGPSQRSRVVNSGTVLRLSFVSCFSGRPSGITAQTATCGGTPRSA